MEFKVLGPLEVTEQGRPLALGGRKRRALLTMLLLRHGQVVSVDALIDGIWGEEAPAGAEHGVQVYVSELRKLLADAEGSRSCEPPRATSSRSPTRRSMSSASSAFGSAAARP